MSGHNRLLSQLTALFSSLLVSAEPAERHALRAKLKEASDLMARSENGFTHGDVAMGLPDHKSPKVRTTACKEGLRPQARCQRLNRVRSAVTQKVMQFKARKVSAHQELPSKASGQLRNLGSCKAICSAARFRLLNLSI
ncbi:MAG: hypothetical protein K9K38_11600 [Rhodoferax sp.]|nr:hypothetical protein [Rhodoferax sp.]MCF8210029.1 hypothetical protein [Rhodoferax sp.]